MPKEIEEIYARGLYKELKSRFNKGSNSILSIFRNHEGKLYTKLKVKGAGIHWHCFIENKNRHLKIHCVDIDRLDVDYKGAEYIIDYYESQEHLVSGRTFNKEKVIQSTGEWMGGIEKDKIYTKYEFIDGKRKRLVESLKRVDLYAPNLKKNCSSFSVEKKNFSEKIWIELNDRSCEGYFWGYEENPRIIFKWHDTKIFEHSDENYELVANLINDWVLNVSKPSELETKYKSVEFGKLGSYYEKGKGVEGEFVLSWDSIEQFYGELSDEWHPFKNDALKLIREMRGKGLDREFRAGQSLYFFIMSRARRHGLEKKHSYVHITFLSDGKMKVKSNYDQTRKDEEIAVKYEGYIKEVVEKLMGEEIE